MFIRDESAPRAFGSGAEPREKLEKFCGAVGEALLRDDERGHDQSWAQKRALGYGNEAFLVLFGYNTPAQTLTCIWKDGAFKGIPWMALFPRRPKL